MSLSHNVSPADISSGFYPDLMCMGISGEIRALYDLAQYSSILPVGLTVYGLICMQSVLQPQWQLHLEEPVRGLHPVPP